MYSYMSHTFPLVLSNVFGLLNVAQNINTVDHWQRVLWFEARSLDRVYVADGSPNITLCSLA